MDIYKHLTDWIPGHMNWIRDVGKDYLGEQGLRPEDFANNMISPKIPVDELGLLVIARMYHTHFGVILKDRIWTTTDDNSSKYCKFFFMYQGGVSFIDTVTGNWDIPSPPAALLTINEDVQKEAVNLVGDKSKVPPPETASMLPLDMRNTHESNPQSSEKMDYDCEKDSKSHHKVDSDQNVDSGGIKMDLDDADGKVDCDQKKESVRKDETDLKQKEMDLDHGMDSQKVDCDKKPSCSKTDSVLKGNRKMECSDTNKDNMRSRQRKRQAPSTRCLRSSGSVCNKKPKQERASLNSRKAGKPKYDLSDLIKGKGRSRKKPLPKPKPKKTDNAKKDKVSDKKKDKKKDGEMQESVKVNKDGEKPVATEMEVSEESEEKKNKTVNKDGKETVNAIKDEKKAVKSEMEVSEESEDKKNETVKKDGKETEKEKTEEQE